MKKILLALIILATISIAAAQFEDFTNKLADKTAKPASNKINEAFEKQLADKLTDSLNNLAAGLKNKALTRNSPGFYRGQSIKIINSKKQEIPIDYYLKNNKNRLADKNRTIPKANYTGEIWIDSPTVKYIYFKDLEIEGQLNIKFDDEPKQNGIIDSYSIDASTLTFHHATITRTAKANTLLKCKEWNFETQTCNGVWQKIRTLTPGESYTIAITPEDPGFGEINITNATHLSSNYSFISDIFNDVKELDNTWSEKIYENEFVRVRYQANLTNGNVIDLYARNPNSTNTYFEIYALGTTAPLLGRSKIFNAAGEWDYITINNLSTPTDMFDFKIVNTDTSTGFLEFDYIHDADRALSDNSLTANNTNITIRDYITVNGSYTVGNGKSTGNWIIGLNDTNNAIKINNTCSAGGLFEVTAINISICLGCTDNGDGTITIPDTNTGTHTVTWTLRACLGASAYSPANLITYYAGGTSTGAYTFNDQTGNITIRPDTTPPVINAVNETPDPVYKGQPINITANVTDNIQVDKVKVEIEGTNYTMNANGPDIWWYSISTAGFYVGVHNYTVYANDTSGNNATPKTGNYTVLDSSIPTSNSPPNQIVDIGTETTIPWILQDEGAPGYYYVQRQGTLFKGPLTWLNNTNLAVKPNTYFTGAWNYTIYFNDSAGNNGTPDTVYITVIDNSTVNCSQYTDGATTPTLRNITIDGNVSDWDAVLTNPLNYQTDLSLEQGDLDHPGTADRDVVNFAYTWDNQYIYFYFRRVNSGTNQVSMIVYIDYGLDGYMNATDKVVKFVWYGSNGKYDAKLYNYIPVGTGDLMNGSGYNLPGSITENSTIEIGVPGGTNPGIVLETRVPWSTLGLSQPRALLFQTSSALGSGTNLPSQLQDNVNTKSTLYSAILFQPNRVGSATNATSVYYDHNLGNCGIANERISLSKISSQGYNTTLYYPNGTIITNITLSPNNFTRIIVKVDIPANATPGTTEITNITATPSNFPASNKTVTDTTSIGEITITPSLRTISGTAGMTATLNYTVTNQQGFNDTLLIGAVSSQGWTYQVYYNGTLINNSLGAFAAGESKTIQLRIFIPSNATIGTIDTTTITVNSSLNPTVTTSAAAVTTVSARLTLDPDYTRSIGIGTSTFYLMTLTNNWNASDVFDLTYTRVLNWSIELHKSDMVTLLTDTNNDSFIDTGIVQGYGTQFQFYVELISPLTAQVNQTERNVIYANASTNRSVSDTARINTTVRMAQTYNNTARTVEDTIFEITKTVYLRANALIAVNNVYFVWLDSNNTPVRTSPTIPVTAEQNADDALTTNNTMPLGNYTVIVYNSQNNVELGRRIFTVYANPPTISLTFPSQNYLNNFTAVNFNWTPVDKYRINLTCNISVNGILNASNISATNGTFKNFTITGFQEGYYNWSTTCWSNFYQIPGTSTTNRFITNFPPQVYPDNSTLTTPFLINETATIRTNSTDYFNVSATYVNITLPNGTTIQTTLNKTANNTYQTLFSNLLLRGTYNITFISNDTFNAINNTQKAYFVRNALKTIDVINFTNYAFYNYTVTTKANTSGLLNLTVDISNYRMHQINLTQHNETNPYSLLRIQEIPITNTGSYSEYSIDPTYIDFYSATFSQNAIGNGVLYKCTDYNETDEYCYGNWTPIQTIIPGQPYSVTINRTDPAFYESSVSPDVGVAPYNYTTFIVAFIDYSENDTSFRIMDTNGTIIVNTTDLDTTADWDSRVDVGMINSTHFAIAWIDGPDDDALFQIWKFNGTNATNTTGITTIDTNVGLFTDIRVTAKQGVVDICFVDDPTRDYDTYAYNSDTGAYINDWTVDNNIGPEATLQNLIACTLVNETRIIHFWFDDQRVNDATYAARSDTGTYYYGPLDIDTDVGEDAQVANTGLNKNTSALIWYDSTDQDITIAGVRISDGATVFGPTDVDTNAGNESRVAATTIRESNTSTTDLFVFAWQDQNSSDIQAAVYNWTGAQVTAPFVVTTAINNTYKLIDITAFEPIANTTLCPATFVVVYSNSTGASEFKWMTINGTEVNATLAEYCRGGRADLIPIYLNFTTDNPNEEQNITINATILNNGTAAAANFNVSFFDGNCTNGTQINGNVTITVLLGGANTTVNVTWNATPVGPHNITVCVDREGKVPEKNETNNNLTRPLNVKANQINYGTIRGNLTLDTALNQTVYDWNHTSGGNVYFTNSNSTINFSKLYPLGKNITMGNTTNDFQDADTNLGMVGFNDSVQVLWAVNASTPKQTITFTIYGRTMTGVPYINTTNTYNFITGILWDATKDTNGEYDTTDKEDLVFVGNININKTGLYGTYDYEAKVPVLMRIYNYNTSKLKFYIEQR